MKYVQVLKYGLKLFDMVLKFELPSAVRNTENKPIHKQKEKYLTT